MRIFLSNVTDVTAKWSLNYVKFPKKSTIGYMTKTAWENENLEKLDDPDVFEFSVTEVFSHNIYRDYYRGRSREKVCLLEKSQKDFACHPCPKTRSKRNTCHKLSSSILG